MVDKYILGAGDIGTILQFGAESSTRPFLSFSSINSVGDKIFV